MLRKAGVHKLESILEIFTDQKKFGKVGLEVYAEFF